MINLLLFTYKISLKDWYYSGILSREILLYHELGKNKVKYKFITFGDISDYKLRNLIGDIDLIPIKNYINANNKITSFLKSLLLPLKLKEVFRNVDLIKTNQIQGAWIACIAKILYNKKLIVRGGYEWLYRHITISRMNKKKFFRYIIEYIFIFIYELVTYKLADGIILTNSQEIKYMIKWFKLKKKMENKQIRLFYNYVDVETFKPLNCRKKKNHILFIGRIEKQKNLINLLNAVESLKGFKLDIIGQGKLKEDLEKYALERNINVEFLGIFPNNILPNIINKYEVFVLPSYWEGNPKVLLEAMSCGLVCIGSNISGINEIIIHKENGILCGTDSDSIKLAIIDLINNEKLRKKLSSNARDYILRNCSLNKIVSNELDFYQKLNKIK